MVKSKLDLVVDQITAIARASAKLQQELSELTPEELRKISVLGDVMEQALEKMELAWDIFWQEKARTIREQNAQTKDRVHGDGQNSGD